MSATLVKLLTSADSAGAAGARAATALAAGAAFAAEPRAERAESRAMRSHARSQVQLLQILIAFFFARKEFLNALQAFDRLGAHAVLHQDFRLQHQVLQGSGAQRRPFGLGRFRRSLRHAGKARGDDLETVFVNLAAQHFQTLLVAGLVGVHVSGAIQAFGGFGIVAHAAMQIEKLEQSLAIVAFPIGGVEQLAHELQQIGRTAMLGHHILHHRDKSAAVSLLRWNCSSLRASATASASCCASTNSPIRSATSCWRDGFC